MRRRARVDGQRWGQMLLMRPKAKPAGRCPTAAVKWSNMLRSFRKRPERSKALERVKQWTRARFQLPQDAPILIREIACRPPRSPPLEAVVSFWTDGDTRHHFKVFKRVEEVVPDDLPPAWLKNALIAVEGEGLECC